MYYSGKQYSLRINTDFVSPLITQGKTCVFSGFQSSFSEKSMHPSATRRTGLVNRDDMIGSQIETPDHVLLQPCSMVLPKFCMLRAVSSGQQIGVPAWNICIIGWMHQH